MTPDLSTAACASQSGRLRELSLAKMSLILGVVLIHCNYLPDINPEYADSAGGHALQFMASLLGGVVQSFLCISGMLFFRDTQSWDWRTWGEKLKRRVRSLLIPYTLWNILAAAVFLVKAGMLGYPSFGVFGERGFNPVLFLEGFWNLQNGFPYDFPLWFLRNLMLLCLLAPAVYAVARNTMVFAVCLMSLIWLPVNDYMFGAAFFIIGAWLGMHARYYRLVYDSRVWTGAALVWLATSLLLTSPSAPGPVIPVLDYLRSISCMAAVTGCAYALSSHRTPRLVRLMIPATFFIYAFHGLLCSLVRGAYIRLFGTDGCLNMLLIYLATFLTLTAVCVAAYYVCRAMSPRLTSILSGGRT